VQQNSLLTNSLKQTITQLGLVNTGKLRDSIIVYIDVKSDTVLMDVKSEDYIKFLIEPYNIVETWVEKPGFKDALSLLLESWLIIKITNELGKTLNWNPKLTITFNGE